MVQNTSAPERVKHASARANERNAAIKSWSLVDESQEYRSVDSEGTEYRYRLLLDGCAEIVECDSTAAVVHVPENVGGHRVVSIADEAFSSSGRSRALPNAPLSGGRLDARAVAAFALGKKPTRNAALVQVVLPNGVRLIGRAAFRGCSHLTEVVLPDTLEEICDYAFSCTALEKLSLPARCTRLSPMALRLGPETMLGQNTPFRSTLERLELRSASAEFRMDGALLSRSLGDGTYAALLCTAAPDELRVPHDVVQLSSGALAGTTTVGTLHVHEGLHVENEYGLLPGGSCTTLIIDLDTQTGAFESVSLEMPDANAARHVLDATLNDQGMVCAQLALDAYDQAIRDCTDPLMQTKLMVARMAKPALLSPITRESFLAVLEQARDAMLVHFGARGCWEVYEHMVDAGLLDAKRLSDGVSLLASRGDTLASAQLLDLKRRRFEKAWDYDL